MQEAFLRHDGFQCGYCTPGQLMSAVALVRDEVAVDDAEIAERMSGNLCRCAAYPHIRTTVRDVRRCQSPCPNGCSRSSTCMSSAGYPVVFPTFGAQFAEVAVDADLGEIRVRWMVGAFAPGRVLNPKTAGSQLLGGMPWGLGQALLESTVMDSLEGRWSQAGLGDYLIPVNADAPDVDIQFVEVSDEFVNPLGIKGVGEIGQVGAAAAIANACFHATGRRVSGLPIRIENLL